MSDTVKLGGGLPQGDLNGLAGLAASIVGDPDEVHVALVLLKTSKLTTDVDSGTVQPTLKVSAIEPIRVGPDAAEARRLIRRSFEHRTGQVELPLEMERELEKLATDPSTGKLYPDPEAQPGEIKPDADLFTPGGEPDGDGTDQDDDDTVDDQDAVSGSDTAPEATEAEMDANEAAMAAAERGEQPPAQDDPVGESDEFDQDGPNAFQPGFSDQQ